MSESKIRKLQAVKSLNNGESIPISLSSQMRLKCLHEGVIAGKVVVEAALAAFRGLEAQFQGEMNAIKSAIGIDPKQKCNFDIDNGFITFVKESPNDGSPIQ